MVVARVRRRRRIDARARVGAYMFGVLCRLRLRRVACLLGALATARITDTDATAAHATKAESGEVLRLCSALGLSAATREWWLRGTVEHAGGQAGGLMSPFGAGLGGLRCGAVVETEVAQRPDGFEAPAWAPWWQRVGPWPGQVRDPVPPRPYAGADLTTAQSMPNALAVGAAGGDGGGGDERGGLAVVGPDSLTGRRIGRAALEAALRRLLEVQCGVPVPVTESSPVTTAAGSATSGTASGAASEVRAGAAGGLTPREGSDSRKGSSDESEDDGDEEEEDDDEDDDDDHDEEEEEEEEEDKARGGAFAAAKAAEGKKAARAAARAAAREAKAAAKAAAAKATALAAARARLLARGLPWDKCGLRRGTAWLPPAVCPLPAVLGLWTGSRHVVVGGHTFAGPAVLALSVALRAHEASGPEDGVEELRAVGPCSALGALESLHLTCRGLSTRVLVALLELLVYAPTAVRAKPAAAVAAAASAAAAPPPSQTARRTTLGQRSGAPHAITAGTGGGSGDCDGAPLVGASRQLPAATPGGNPATSDSALARRVADDQREHEVELFPSRYMVAKGPVLPAAGFGAGTLRSTLPSNPSVRAAVLHTLSLTVRSATLEAGHHFYLFCVVALLLTVSTVL